MGKIRKYLSGQLLDRRLKIVKDYIRGDVWDMERRCIEFSRKCDWNRMADLTESTYKKVLK